MSSFEKIREDPLGYMKCWECGNEREPTDLQWILWNRKLMHICNECRKKKEAEN